MSDELDCQKNNEQCRTHHEKMLKKYGTIENIINTAKGYVDTKTANPEPSQEL